jgi:integrase
LPTAAAELIGIAWLVGQGVHIKAIADLLGHSPIAITGDIYGLSGALGL